MIKLLPSPNLYFIGCDLSSNGHELSVITLYKMASDRRVLEVVEQNIFLSDNTLKTAKIAKEYYLKAEK